MKKIIFSLVFAIFFISGAYAAVDRVIDPEIPIDSELVNFEDNFDDVIVSLMAVGVLGLAGISGTIIIFLGVLFLIKGIPII